MLHLEYFANRSGIKTVSSSREIRISVTLFLNDNKNLIFVSGMNFTVMASLKGNSGIVHIAACLVRSYVSHSLYYSNTYYCDGLLLIGN